jgi:hypothetical protein
MCISLFARFCYMLILEPVPYKKLNSEKHFTIGLGITSGK